MNRIGKSPGLTLRNCGGVVISGGSRRAAVDSAVCTSSAALSMSRLSSNWMMIEVEPWVDDEVIALMPAMVDNCRSIGDGDRGRHGFRAGARQLRLDLDGREVDPRQRGDREQPVGEHAEHDERRRDQRRHNRPADAELGRFMGQDPAGALALRGATLAPLVRRSWPSVTTVSPPCRPLSSTVSFCCDARHLDRLHGGDAVLDHEDEGAGLARPAPRSAAPRPPPPRGTSAARAPACRATAARRRSAWWRER